MSRTLLLAVAGALVLAGAAVVPFVPGSAGAAEDRAKLLKSKDVHDRLEAVQDLRQNGGEDAEELLLEALGDRDWEVVEWAAEGLGEQDCKGAVDALADLAVGGPIRRVRLAASRSLGRLDPASAAEDLAKKAGGKQAEAALEALALLAAIPGDRPAAALEAIRKGVERGLRDEEPHVRRAAARGLPAFPPVKAAAMLQDLLYDEDVGVAAAALDGVRARPDPAYLEPLLTGLRHAELRDVLERRILAAIFDVVALQPPGDAAAAAATPVADALSRAGSGVEAARLARALGLLGATEPPPRHLDPDEKPPEMPPPLVPSAWALEKLERALRHEDEAARAAAVHALGRIGTDAALERAASSAKADQSARVRLHALRAVVLRRPCPDAASVGLAADRLQYDENARVREAAAVALGAKGSDAISVLEKALNDQDWSVAVCAAVSLGKTRLPDALPALRAQKASAKDWRLRGAAVVGLGRLQHKEAVDDLLDALEDKEPVVARTAYEFLRRMTAVDIKPTAKAWREWWDAEKADYEFVDREEEARKAQKYGYAPDNRGVYEGQDVVVLQSRGDSIEKLLERLGIEFRLTRQAQVQKAALHPFGVFVSNCTGEITDDDVAQLQWFVRVGGYLFCSCWALDHTAERVYDGVVGKLPTNQEVLDNVEAEACPTDSPYLEGVFDGVTRPIYVLYGSHLIDVHDPERVEVLIDSPDCSTRWGGGNLACWFDAGHGVILDSANHFDLQGLERATGLKSVEDRKAYAMDHMGLDHEEIRQLDGEKVWKSQNKAAKAARDLSAFRFITNFVRYKRQIDP